MDIVHAVLGPLRHVLPNWLLKLPEQIQLLILLAVIFHVGGLCVLLYLGLSETKTGKPDFKAKLT